MGDAAETASVIAAALRAVRTESVVYWDSIDTAAFLAPIGNAWSPADTVRHLTKSIRAVTQGMALPRWILRLAFGRATRPSRSYDEVRSAYLARLARGADAGRYAPTPRPVTVDGATERRRIMAAHDAAVEALASRVARWSEPALDTLRLPHPLLGRLTVREMLVFSVYHIRHHVAVIQRKQAGGWSPPRHSPSPEPNR